MENQLQQVNHNLSTRLNNKEQDIVKELWHINQVITYQLTDTQLEDWSKSIHSLYPAIEIKELTKAINLLKTGKVKWDVGVGLPNVFSALSAAWQYNDDLSQKFVG